MTPEQFQKDRAGLLMDYRYLLIGWLQGTNKTEPKIEEIMQELNDLDREFFTPSPKDAYYAFLRQLDRAYDSLKQAEGNPAEERKMIDLMMSTLSARAERLAREEKGL